jgi:hypothetical protein
LNNLKQIGLAMQNYHDAKKTLPPGTGPNPCCWGTWMPLTLAYIEQEQVGELYVNWGGDDTTGPRYSAAPNTTNVCNKRFATMTCPSDQPNKPFGDLTNHNYAVNFGTTAYNQQANLNGVLQRGFPFGWAKYIYTDPNVLVNNVRPSRGIPIADILDGTSNTLMVAEVLQGQGSDLRGFTWWGDACNFTTYLPPNTSQPDVIYTPGYCNNLPRLNLPCTGTPTATAPSMHASRSRHPGGVQVVLCDGSSRFLGNSISITLWRAASTTRGGEAFNSSSL